MGFGGALDIAKPVGLTTQSQLHSSRNNGHFAIGQRWQELAICKICKFSNERYILMYFQSCTRFINDFAGIEGRDSGEATDKGGIL